MKNIHLSGEYAGQLCYKKRHEKSSYWMPAFHHCLSGDFHAGNEFQSSSNASSHA
jgi:hypothetical protein